MTRDIHSRLSSRQVPDLLQNLFTAEIISPSPKIWLISPWISDIPIIDNTANTFLALDPTWARSKIRLSQILITLSYRNSRIHIATRPDTHNRGLIETLKSHANQRNLRIFSVEELHTKGILADTFFLAGSMNFTFNGITINEEMLHLEVDPEKVAEQKLIFSDRWSGGEV